MRAGSADSWHLVWLCHDRKVVCRLAWGQQIVRIGGMVGEGLSKLHLSEVAPALAGVSVWRKGDVRIVVRF